MADLQEAKPKDLATRL